MSRRNRSVVETPVPASVGIAPTARRNIPRVVCATISAVASPGQTRVRYGAPRDFSPFWSYSSFVVGYRLCPTGVVIPMMKKAERFAAVRHRKCLKMVVKKIDTVATMPLRAGVDTSVKTQRLVRSIKSTLNGVSTLSG